MTILLDNVSVDGPGPEVEFNGGKRVLVVRGDNFGGGEVDIEVRSTGDSRFKTLDDGSFTEDGTKTIDFTAIGLVFRASLNNSSGASNVFAEIL